MLKLNNYLIDLLIPKSCFSCKLPSNEALCSKCVETVNFIGINCCNNCGYPTLAPVDICRQCRGKKLNFTNARSAICYEGKIKELVYKIKSNGSFELIDYFVKNFLQLHQDIFIEVDVVTFIPTILSKKVKRGHNPSELIAKIMAKRLNKQFLDLFKYERLIIDQASLKVDERILNVKNAFKLRQNTNLIYKKVLVVDDVYTTGSTVNDACRVLKKQGTSSKVFTIARTI